MKADKTSHSGGTHDMEKRFWFCLTSSSRCTCGVRPFIAIMVSRTFSQQIH
uniref:Uncharacterized protein n=1 Tax=Arundo donax TaxID=35708 RepID=A0A0A8YYR1_ARUDO